MTQNFDRALRGAPRRAAISALLATSACLTPAAALAQIAPPSTSSTGATVTDPEAHPTATQPGLPASTPNDTEIVVTALKRATSVQRTPISITAVSADTLNRQNITDTNALARIAPSLVINENSNGGSRVIIRNLYATGEPLVGLYYDEVPLSGTGGVSNDAGGTLPGLRLFDVERVEVLRGPQGTLYGASSMGGTIRVIFAKPNLKYYSAAVDGQVTSSADSGDDVGGQANAMLNIPIIPDKLAVRAVGFYDQTPGYIDNSLLHRSNINSNKSYGGRLTARIRPVDNVTIDLMSVYQDRKAAGTTWNYSEYQLTGKKFDQPLLIREPQVDRLKLFSGTLDWDLGFATLITTASYSDRFLSYKFDYTPYFARWESVNNTQGLVAPYAGDPTRIPGYSTFLSDCSTGFYSGTTCNGAGYQRLVNGYGNTSTYQPQSNKTSTEEVRLADDRHRFKWTVGVYHSFRKNFTESLLFPTDPVTGLQFYPTDQNGNSYVVGPINMGLDRTINDSLEQLAGFGEATWDVTSKLSVTAGARYFDYKKTTSSAVLIPSYIGGNKRQAPLTTKGNESGKLLKFGANYKFTNDIMAYVTASQGYRPGGVNQTLGLPSYAAIYSSDSVWSYEAGLKTAFLDHKVIVNLDAFRMDWKNMQISASYNNAFGFITNSSSPARIQGVEFDTSVNPIEHLSLHLSGSYIKAKLLGDQALPAGITPCPVPFIAGTTGCATISAGKKGDTIPYSPKWTLQASADYGIPIQNDLRVMAHGDVAYRGSSLTTYNLPLYAASYPNGPAGTAGGAALYTLPAFATVGLRFGVEKQDGKWGVYLFANNLFNTMGLTSLTNGQSSATTLGYRYNGAVIKPNYVTSIAPRLVGVELKARFQ